MKKILQVFDDRVMLCDGCVYLFLPQFWVWLLDCGDEQGLGLYSTLIKKTLGLYSTLIKKTLGLYSTFIKKTLGLYSTLIKKTERDIRRRCRKLMTCVVSLSFHSFPYHFGAGVNIAFLSHLHSVILVFRSQIGRLKKTSLN
jgi:hypothetical protein